MLTAVVEEVGLAAGQGLGRLRYEDLICSCVRHHTRYFVYGQAAYAEFGSDGRPR